MTDSNKMRRKMKDIGADAKEKGGNAGNKIENLKDKAANRLEEISDKDSS